MSIEENRKKLTALEQQNQIWQTLLKSAARHRRHHHQSENHHADVAKSSSARQWPSYNEVLQDVRKTDYKEILTCSADIHPLGGGGGGEGGNGESGHRRRDKKICPFGAVCCAKLELFPHPNSDLSSSSTTTTACYSGLLEPGQTVEHCIVRLSSALQPPVDKNDSAIARIILGQRLVNAKLFPAVAVKLFRGNGIESGNMLFLGCKVGQDEDNFFAHCLSTAITSKMPTTLKPILSIFKRYSKQPLLLGNSNLCTYNAMGQQQQPVIRQQPVKTTTSSSRSSSLDDDHNGDDDSFNFPFCLTIKPINCTPPQEEKDNNNNDEEVVEEEKEKTAKVDNARSVDSFLDDLLKIPSGTVLYDLFASPDPLSVADGSKLQRIGRLVSTSEMILSPPGDGLFFKHQNKDEDFHFKPNWKEELDEIVVIKNESSGVGKVRKGSVASLSGWKLFEEQIKEGRYVDFEKATTTNTNT